MLGLSGDPEVLAPVPSVARRWREEAVEWVGRKRATRGQYEGRNGDEAIRFLTRLGEKLEASGDPRSPRTFDCADVLRVLPWFGVAPKTKRFYLCLLSGFLRDRGNEAIHESGVLSTLSKVAPNRRWISEQELDRLMDSSVGLERVVVALEAFQGLRRIEVLRCRLSDLELGGPKAALWIRGKRHRGEPSRHVPKIGRAHV